MDIRDMPSPTVKLWRRVSELRDRRAKQSKELQAAFKLAESNKEDADKFSALIEQTEEKMITYRKENFDTKISIVAEAFGVKDPEALTVEEVTELYPQIESLIMEKMVTKSKELPNAEAPASQN